MRKPPERWRSRRASVVASRWGEVKARGHCLRGVAVPGPQSGQPSRARRARMQNADRISDVESLALPAGRRRARIDPHACSVVLCFQRAARVRRHGGRRRHFGDWPSVRPPEYELSSLLSFDLKSIFVNRPVMPATQHREIRQICRAAKCPMPNVMCLPERPSASCRITTRIASHARRCDVSAETCVPSSRTDWPGAPAFASTGASMWMTT